MIIGRNIRLEIVKKRYTQIYRGTKKEDFQIKDSFSLQWSSLVKREVKKK